MRPIRTESHGGTALRAGRARSAAIAAAVAATLGLFAAPEAMSQAASQADVKALQNQVQQLQQQVATLQEKQAAAATTPASTPAGSAKPAEPGPGIHAGPVTITFGGYIELAPIYRSRDEVADVGSNFNTGIPYPNVANYHINEFRMSARQSRISLLTQGPTEGPNYMEAYFETDFLGAAPTANSNESNSYNLRLRQAYGVYARQDVGFSILFGQAWSLATLYKVGLKPRSEDVPLTIDAQYVPGFNWTRNAQLRFTERFNENISVGLSLESPQALIFNGPNPLPPFTVISLPGGSLYNSGQNYSLDPAPDVILKIAADPGWGHYEVWGMERWFRDRAAGVNNTVSGGSVGAGFILPLVPRLLDFQLSGLTGNGIGRYASVQLPDVTVNNLGEFSTIKEYQYLAGLFLYPNADWTFYAYYGQEKADAKAFTNAAGTLGFGYGSPLYDNSGCLTLGSAKCAANTREVWQGTGGFWWKYYSGKLGNLQLGLQYSYTKREIFTGVGGDPSTNISIGMLSFRYYPYQK